MTVTSISYIGIPASQSLGGVDAIFKMSFRLSLVVDLVNIAVAKRRDSS